MPGAAHPTEEDVDAHAQGDGAHERDHIAHGGHCYSYCAAAATMTSSVQLSMSGRARDNPSRVSSAVTYRLPAGRDARCGLAPMANFSTRRSEHCSCAGQ